MTNNRAMEMHTIGFVGLGAMGAAMARQLVAKQFKVVGFDSNAAAVEALAAAGGHAAQSVAEAANGADALIVMVVNADQAENVLFEAGGLEALATGCAGYRVFDVRAGAGGSDGCKMRGGGASVYRCAGFGRHGWRGGRYANDYGGGATAGFRCG